MKKILIHLAIMAGIVIALALGTLWYLDIYTNHDAELIPVEDLNAVHVDKALEILANAGLEGVVTDTVYKDGAKKLTVINQNPPAGLSVKPGRKVYLVINTNEVPMVEVPDLALKTSLQQATSILIRRHLKVGEIIKKVSPAVRTKDDQPVLSQLKSGTKEDIKPGTMIERNSKIDLVIGVPSESFSEEGEETPEENP